MTKEEMVAARIPETLHENPLLKETKDFGALAQIAVDLKSYQGSSIRVPGPEAGENDVKEFREKLKKHAPTLVELPENEEKAAPVEALLMERLGRPKDPKGYKLIKDLGVAVPEGVKIDEEGSRELAGKLGLTQKQYKSFMQGVVEKATAEHAASGQLMKAIKTEFGEATEERLLAAASTAKKLGRSDEYVERVRTGQVSVEEARAWVATAKALGTEGAEFGTHTPSRSTRMTPEEARERLGELRRNPALNDTSNPARGDLLLKLKEYTRIAYGIKEGEEA